MSLSVVHFKMHHGKETEQVHFSGNGIKLIDLKREIVEKKKFTSTIDFDLQITDENKKEYVDDNEIVPKNSSVIVKRIPAKNSKAGLMARLNNRPSYYGADTNHSKDIIMPMKEEKNEDIPLPSNIANSGEEEDVFEAMMKEEATLKKTLPTNDLKDMPPVGSRQIQNLPKRNPGMLAAHHQCEICGKYGHYPKQCSQSSYPEPRISNLPKSNVRKVLTLDGIDTSNRTVIKNSDGTFDIFEPSAAGLDQLKRDSQIAKLNLATVPSHLKCSLSNSLLTEAVELPCCKRIVNDTIIRETLMKSSLKCPFCFTANVSPDSVIVRYDIRSQVEEYIHENTTVNDSSTLSVLPVQLPPLIDPVKPPPPPPPMNMGFPIPPIPAPVPPTDPNEPQNESKQEETNQAENTTENIPPMPAAPAPAPPAPNMPPPMHHFPGYGYNPMMPYGMMYPPMPPNYPPYHHMPPSGMPQMDMWNPYMPMAPYGMPPPGFMPPPPNWNEMNGPQEKNNNDNKPKDGEATGESSKDNNDRGRGNGGRRANSRGRGGRYSRRSNDRFDNKSNDFKKNREGDHERSNDREKSPKPGPTGETSDKLEGDSKPSGQSPSKEGTSSKDGKESNGKDEVKSDKKSVDRSESKRRSRSNSRNRGDSYRKREYDRSWDDYERKRQKGENGDYRGRSRDGYYDRDRSFRDDRPRDDRSRDPPREERFREMDARKSSRDERDLRDPDSKDRERDLEREREKERKEKDREREKERDKGREKDRSEKDKEKSEKERSDKDRERSKNGEKERSDKDRDREKENKDKDRKERTDKERSEKDRSDKEKDRSDKEKDKDRKDKDRDRERKDRDKDREKDKERDRDQDRKKSSRDEGNGRSDRERDRDRDRDSTKRTREPDYDDPIKKPRDSNFRNDPPIVYQDKESNKNRNGRSIRYN